MTAGAVDTRVSRPAGRGDRLPSLTGLRILAAVAVVAYHVAISLLPRLGVGAGDGFGGALLYLLGPAGVTVFFVLSGFVLTWVHRPGERPAAFWRRRAVKLFPAHVVVLLAVAGVAVLAGVGVNPVSAGPTLLLLQGWLPLQEVLLDYGLNSPTWSLSAELFFYAIFPALVLLVRRLPVGRLWTAFGSVAAVSAAMPLVAGLLPAEPLSYGEGSPPWWSEWFLYYFPPVRALDFLLGVLIAQILLRRGLPRLGRLRLGPGGALLVAAAGYVAAALLFGVYGSAVLIAAPAALLIATLAAADLSDRAGWLGSRPMVYLGERSFALYLVHFPVIAYGPIRLVTTPWDATTTPGAALIDAAWTVLISLLLAWALHGLVERPAMRRWSRGRTAVPASPTPERSPT